MANTSDIKNGAVLLENGKRMKVLEFLHVNLERVTLLYARNFAIYNQVKLLKKDLMLVRKLN